MLYYKLSRMTNMWIHRKHNKSDIISNDLFAMMKFKKELVQSLNTPLNIKLERGYKSKMRMKVTINYNTAEDLEKIIEIGKKYCDTITAFS